MNLRAFSSLVILALLASAVPAMAAARSAAHRQCDGFAQIDASAERADRVPEGLAPSDWSSIRAAYEANRHAAFAVEGGYVARNPGQQWRTRFDGRGFETTPDAGGWTWGLELVGYGRAGAAGESQRLAPVSNRCEAGAPRITARGQRVEYQWDDNLTEWYVNDARGLEHGYTVHRRPGSSAVRAGEQGACSDRRLKPPATIARPPGGQEAGGSHEPLQLALAVRGDLRPRLCNDGRGVTFVDSNGAAVVNYAGLTVFDANGANVPARFDAPTPKASSVQSATFSIVVDDREATYPLTIDPVAQQAYLKASNPGESDQFGFSVAVSGDTVVIGAPFEDSNATGVNGNQADNTSSNSGAAYVFGRSGGVWSQQAYLKASNTGASDRFGVSVAVSGDTVLVGAYTEDSSATGVNGNQADNGALSSGAAYVFVRSGGVWSQQAYLKASNTGTGDEFGLLVAVSGDTVVIGAPDEDSNATGVNGNQINNSAADSGAAYVFVRSGGVWSQQAYLKASNTGASDRFGLSAGVSGDTVVVGAAQEASNATGVNGNQTDNSAIGSGAVYVFVRSGAVWSQQAYLKASNTALGDQFGWSVAISVDTVVVGAYLEDSNATGIDGNQADNSAANSGAAYVFIRGGGIWTQQAYLKASNTGANDIFGYSVAASGDTVVVGAVEEDSSATGVNGNEADNSASNAGAAYLFVRVAGVWSQQNYLKASNTDSQDGFGYAVAVGGDTVVVGAYLEDSNAAGVNSNQADNSASASGAAYVFTGVGCLTLGDMNCDCSVDLADVGPFVQALLDPAGYMGSYPSCNILRGDMQPDGLVDGEDVQGFVDLLIP